MISNEEEDFFGFDTKMPVSNKGPQQSFGDVELEDTYDALNDETFGVMTIDGDWEEEHEKLAEQLKFEPDETPSYKYVDDYQEESAYPVPVQGGLKDVRKNFAGHAEVEDAASVAARISEMLLDDDDLDSLLTKSYCRSIDPQLLDTNTASPSLFENDMATSIWSAPELQKTQPSKPEMLKLPLPPGFMPQAFKTVEELERDLLKQQQHPMPPIQPVQPQALTLEELERNILSLNQNNAPNVHYVPPLNMMLLPPSIPAPGMLLNLPPPSQPLMVPPMHGIVPLPPLPNDIRHLKPSDDPREGHYRKKTFDEYAGLMSTKEKQWLMSIQINQLISDNPLVEDYYFTMLRLKCLDRLQQKTEKATCSRLIIPEKKIETKTYSPAQFANSLGKLQVVTYTAPRRIIDVSIAQPMADTQDQSRKLKQILLDIEKLFAWLLHLEDAEMRAESTSDSTVQTHYKQVAEDNFQKLQNFLLSSDRISQILLVRKGKVFLLRLWNRLRPSIQEIIVKSLFLNCPALIRRDAQDHLLVRFLPLVNDVLASLTDLEALLRFSSCLDSSKASHIPAIVSSKIGIDFISLILYRGAELFPACKDSSTRSSWLSFVSVAHREMVGLKKPIKSNLGLLQAQLFVQAGLDKSIVNKAKLLVE